VQSVINLDDEMITLLNIDNLVRHPEALADLLNPDEQPENLVFGNFYEQYFTDANFKTKSILRQRALNLREVNDHQVATQLVSLAVVKISDRYFAFDLALVREFINIGRITTIPCCPEHIIGNVNLRGEILTLVDICQPLNLAKTLRNQSSKAVVIEVKDLTVGIVVEEVLDVVDFSPEELQPVPVAMNSQAVSLLKAVANYRNQLINVIDLPKLLGEGAMIVELTT
jgi:purine-binding chemotaxis protein CheW